MYKEYKYFEKMNDNVVIEVKPRKSKWIFNIINLKVSPVESAIDLKWGYNFPIDYVEVNGKIEKLKEFNTKEEALKIGTIYYKFLKEVFNKRISVVI